MPSEPITFRVRILRKQAGLPRYVVVQPEDRPLIQLMFGQPEEG